MSAVLRDSIALAHIQNGQNQPVSLVAIRERWAWDSTAKRQLDHLESYILDIVCHAGRYHTFSVVIPAENYDLSITDANLEQNALDGTPFPQIGFTGLIVKFWSSRDSSVIQESVSATRVFLVDSKGKPI